MNRQTLMNSPEPHSPPLPFPPLHWTRQAAWAVAAAAAFHLAYEFASCTPLILLFLFSLIQLAHVRTRREALFMGWMLGLAIYGPQLAFFYSIFGAGAIALWLVLGSWLGFYLMAQRFALIKLPRPWSLLLAPLLWTGLEFGRSELYYLRFSWLNAGYLSPQLSAWTGMYGVGFWTMLVAALGTLGWRERKWVPVGFGLGLLAILALLSVREPRTRPSSTQLQVAGVQLELEPYLVVLEALEKLHGQHPTADLLMLSEYSFDGPVPPMVKQWCARRRRYLIAGAKEYLDPGEHQYFNTAVVIGPDGQEVFKQVKSVPIQFFKDGAPAPDQKVWNSPWGKLGLCVCYDLSYTRVTDELIRLGAQAILVPTMDMQAWGERQHRLHGRVAPVRAAEYRVPIFRLCSSGISQAIDPAGHVLATAPFPGQGESMHAMLALPQEGGRLPFDRMLVWLGVATAVFVLGWHAVDGWRSGRRAAA